MMRRENFTTHPQHVFIFGTIFVFVVGFITYTLTYAVQLRPENIILHTSLVYYNGQFSEKKVINDIKTALYLLNESDKDYVYATVFEYDKNYKEVRTAVQIGPQQTQFIKTDGPGVVHLVNAQNTASSTVIFSRFATIKKYTIPVGFKF